MTQGIGPQYPSPIRAATGLHVIAGDLSTPACRAWVGGTPKPLPILIPTPSASNWSLNWHVVCKVQYILHLMVVLVPLLTDLKTTPSNQIADGCDLHLLLPIRAVIGVVVLFSVQLEN